MSMLKVKIHVTNLKSDSPSSFTDNSSKFENLTEILYVPMVNVMVYNTCCF